MTFWPMYDVLVKYSSEQMWCLQGNSKQIDLYITFDLLSYFERLPMNLGTYTKFQPDKLQAAFRILVVCSPGDNQKWTGYHKMSLRLSNEQLQIYSQRFSTYI